ncbi:L-lactate dehydrogenase complex protein LldE [Paenibacillus tianmuensis]|uniref:L-lactate dehydrogenase complex protein LldE n=1 Tax=Paenibacillus tianmuensis TaxID=624147 RepID=A0A1G4RB91_9BACL|nr:(Fe-S)-binding protein [Paenibacillus tianmuensis]SCW54030.1 L-lactate dehydrogenase complex protein LldE [Paenibacillus tianmuensis]
MRVSLFITCLADQLYPEVGESVVRLLHRYGCEVDFPQMQTCCGQPAYNSGYQDEAREVARNLIRAFEHSDYVVSPSGSCTGMVHHYYPQLFENEPEWKAKAEKLIGKTYEFSQFLVHVLGVKDLGAVHESKATYHPSCHAMRLLGVREEPGELLAHIKGLELVELPRKEDCCGFGGTFAVKMADMSEAMVCEKAANVCVTNVDLLIGTDMGCLMNIGGRLNKENKPVRVMHLAQLLEEGVKRGERHGK